MLRDLYTDQGLNLSVGRVSVGSSDYSPELYTYDEVAGDTALEHFSVEPDEEFVLPMLREVLKIKPELFLFSSPWSPPGWMKTGGSMCGGLVTLNSQTGELSYSGQYRAMRHFSGLIQSGATVLKTETRGDDTDCMASYPNLSKPVSACAFRNPDGTTVVQLTNPNETRRQMQTTFGGKKWYFELLGQSITSVVFAGE